MDDGALRFILERERPEFVMPVRSFGFVRDLAPIADLARQFGSQVIVDGAAAFGHPGRQNLIGSSAGEIEVSSLHATKAFSVGEAGLIFAPSAVSESIRRSTNFGIQSSDEFGDGGNMKLAETHAAIGLAMLGRIDAFITERETLAKAYDAFFAPRSGAVTLPVHVGSAPWQCYPILLGSAERCASVAEQLKSLGIEARRYYRPTLDRGYRGRERALLDGAETPVAHRLSDGMLCLPIWVGMTETERNYLFACLTKVF